MGGKIPKEKLQDFSWELHISELKFQLKSNVVPIGLIKKGIFYHRALLFKVFKMFCLISNKVKMFCVHCCGVSQLLTINYVILILSFRCTYIWHIYVCVYTYTHVSSPDC